MKILDKILYAAFLTLTLSAYADETVSEQLKAKTNNVKRAVKKASHRLNEAVCAENDLKCASKKVKNRAIEVKDATVDGAKELKHKID